MPHRNAFASFLPPAISQIGLRLRASVPTALVSGASFFLPIASHRPVDHGQLPANLRPHGRRYLLRFCCRAQTPHGNVATRLDISRLDISRSPPGTLRPCARRLRAEIAQTRRGLGKGKYLGFRKGPSCLASYSGGQPCSLRRDASWCRRLAFRWRRSPFSASPSPAHRPPNRPPALSRSFIPDSSISPPELTRRPSWIRWFSQISGARGSPRRAIWPKRHRKRPEGR